MTMFREVTGVALWKQQGPWNQDGHPSLWVNFLNEFSQLLKKKKKNLFLSSTTELTLPPWEAILNTVSYF